MATPETLPEGGEVTESKLWLGEMKVKSYKEADEKTPSGLRIIEITTEKNGTFRLTEAKFDAVKSYQKNDATKMRDELVKVAGQKIYALLMEYGPSLPEVDHILNEAVRLSNDATEQANNILWGVEASWQRSLLDVNNILAKNHEEKKTTPEDDTSSERSGADSVDTEQD